MYGVKLLSSKSSSENTIQVVISVVIIWIKPLRVMVVLTPIWLKTEINASLCVLENANMLQMDI